MVVKPEQDRVRNLLTDTVTLLCKNGLTYSKEMKVQGLLGITLDEDEVFVVHIDEKFADLISGKEIPTIDFPDALELDNNKDSEMSSSRKRRKRRNSKDSDVGSIAGNATPSKRHRDANSHDSHEIRVKQEQPEDVICLEDNDMANIKPDPLREASFSTSSFGQLEQTTQPYITGMHQSGAQSITSQISDNSNASWDGSSSSQLPQLTPYKGAAGMQGGTPGSGGASWNPADPSVLASLPPDLLYDTTLGMCELYDQHTGEKVLKYRCLFPGCGHTSTHKRHARRHQNSKHGRQPRNHAVHPLPSHLYQHNTSHHEAHMSHCDSVEGEAGATASNVIITTPASSQLSATSGGGASDINSSQSEQMIIVDSFTLNNAPNQNRTQP